MARRRKPPRMGAKLGNPVGVRGSVGQTVGGQGLARQQVQAPAYTNGTQSTMVGGPPLDPNYEAYKLSANRNMAIGTADAAYQKGVTEQEFGYGASGAANPYSRAKLLEENFKRSQLGTTNSYASQGQMTSGAYGRMQGENARQYSIASDQNRRQFDQAIYGINQGQAQNAANYGIGLDNEAFEALLRAMRGG